ncbi:MAG: NAD(P)/FAD-dependent oxidoreductase [Clostridia bacterium]|nr:NAD(P)/FAD-dependent oxidoreductase [Clostridia bacterium]
MNLKSDILIIGSGITGCAVAREISRYNVSVSVLDRGNDIAEGATKANSGLVHAGYDAVPGTKKAYYNIRGAALYPDLCAELGVPYRQNGALVIALNEDDIPAVQKLKARGDENGVQGLEILGRDALLAMEPSLNPQVVCGLHVPTGALVSPYEMAFALADDAALNGVSFYFNQEVTFVSRLPDGSFAVSTGCSEYRCRILVNCAGASGADLHNQLSDRKLQTVHRRGQYYLLDRAVQPPFSHTIFQCPSAMGKGVLVTPTVHGNVLLGPTAEDIPDPLDTATTSDGLAEVLRKAALTWPALSVRSNITNFSGVRAHLTVDDFVVGSCDGVPGYFEAIGIESPGLSSAPAIGSELAGMIAGMMGLSRKEKTVPYPLPARPFHDMTDEERAAAVKSDPSYGQIICRCETVTEAEIRAAIRRPVGARSIDAVKRRTRAGMGRCQGGFCLPRVAAIIAEETGLTLQEITKNGGSGYLLAGSLDSFLKEVQDHE